MPRNDAAAHQLSRNSRNRPNQRRRRLGRGHRFGRGIFSVLGGASALMTVVSVIAGIVGLISGLFRHHKHVVRGTGQHRKPRKAKVARHRAQHGIRRPPAVRQPSAPRAPTRPQTTFSTGVFDVTTRRLRRMRLLP